MGNRRRRASMAPRMASYYHGSETVTDQNMGNELPKI